MKKIPKVETKYTVANKLAAHFGVSVQSAVQWFDSGCPMNVEEGIKWKETRIEEAKIAQHRAHKSKYELAQEQATEANKDINFDAMSPLYRNLCDLVCDLYLVGLSVNAIAERLGTSLPVLYRIITQHPRTKDRDKEMASAGWADIRRLAQAEIRERLMDPHERAKLKMSDLNFVAGTAHDKLDKADNPTEVKLSIRAKVEALSYDELIKTIKDKSNAIEGEFTKVESEMSPKEGGEEIKTPGQSQ